MIAAAISLIMLIAILVFAIFKSDTGTRREKPKDKNKKKSFWWN